jgi:hypothetical protein
MKPLSLGQVIAGGASLGAFGVAAFFFFGGHRPWILLLCAAACGAVALILPGASAVGPTWPRGDTSAIPTPNDRYTEADEQTPEVRARLAGL